MLSIYLSRAQQSLRQRQWLRRIRFADIGRCDANGRAETESGLARGLCVEALARQKAQDRQILL